MSSRAAGRCIQRDGQHRRDETVAITVDLYFACGATMHDLLFWSSLVFSLTMGLIAAYPVNVLLIHLGVKEGMHSPKCAAAHS